MTFLKAFSSKNNQSLHRKKDTIAPWSFPSFQSEKLKQFESLSSQSTSISSEEMEAIEIAFEKKHKTQLEAEKEKAYQKGLEEGLMRIQDQKMHFEKANQECVALMSSLEKIHEQVAHAFAHEVVDLALQIAHMVIRVESKINSDILQHTLVEVFEKLHISLQSYVITANAHDIEEIQNYIKEHYPSLKLQFQMSEHLLPGGFRVQGASTFLDASLEQRLLDVVLEKKL